MSEKTKVGKSTIPIKNWHFPSIVSFRAGAHGTKERGDFMFWTAVMKKEKGKARKRTWGRAWLTRDPGERLRRIGLEQKSARTKETRAAYKRLWRGMGGGRKIAYIRPANMREILKWMSTHWSDARYIFSIRIDPRSAK